MLTIFGSEFFLNYVFSSYSSIYLAFASWQLAIALVLYVFSMQQNQKIDVTIVSPKSLKSDSDLSNLR